MNSDLGFGTLRNVGMRLLVGMIVGLALLTALNMLFFALLAAAALASGRAIGGAHPTPSRSTIHGLSFERSSPTEES